MRRVLFALLVLTSLLAVAPAQTKTPPAKTPTKKSMPMRDPKTGRFMKKATPPKKTMPMRDPKTGRFMKKPGAPTKPPKKGG